MQAEAGAGPEATFPSQILVCPAGKTERHTTSAEEFGANDYEEVVKEVISAMDPLADRERTDYAACLLRLAGHDLMDYRRGREGERDSTGGSDGCVNFADPDNKGLASCLKKADLNQIYEGNCDRVSMADFTVIAGEAVVIRLATDYVSSDIFRAGGWGQRFRDQFRLGRTTADECKEAAGLMPNPENGCQDLKDIFVDHIFYEKWNKRKSWTMTTAISGAHTIGSAKKVNSGYEGHWSDAGN